MFTQNSGSPKALWTVDTTGGSKKLLSSLASLALCLEKTCSDRKKYLYRAIMTILGDKSISVISRFTMIVIAVLIKMWWVRILLATLKGTWNKAANIFDSYIFGPSRWIDSTVVSAFEWQLANPPGPYFTCREGCNVLYTVYTAFETCIVNLLHKREIWTNNYCTFI